MKTASINLKRVLFALLATISLVVMTGPTTFARERDDDDEKKVNICHATNSEKNPYEAINVSENSIHDEHELDFPYAGPLNDKDKPVKDDGDAWCLDQRTVTPTAVTFVAPTCTVKGTYTVPTMAGVIYYMGEAVVAAGTYTVNADSTVTVTSKLAEGYFLDKGAVTEWSKAFVTPTCPVTTTTGTVAGASTTATPQVAVKPAGSANAGGAGLTALFGLGASTVVLAFGAVIRKFSL